MINPLKVAFFLLGNHFPALIKDVVRRGRVDGLLFDLDLTENIDRHLYYSGVWEPKVRSVLREILRGDMVVLDVGANIGAHALPMAAILAKGGGRVLAFEPTAYAFNKLAHNLALNHLPNLTIEKLALSDKAGAVRCQVSSPCLRASWNMKYRDSNRKIEEDIPTTTLDERVQAHGLERVDFIKMDTDGFELRILTGAEETLRRFRPVMLVEIGRALGRVGDRIEDLCELLEGHGYKLHDLEDRRHVSWEAALARLASVSGLDYLCIPEGKACP